MREVIQNNELEQFVTLVQQLSLARDIETIMTIVRKAAREFTKADGATFILKDQDKCFYADENAISPLWKGQRFPMKTCISGWAMINRKPAIIEDIYEDERIPIDAYRPTFVKSLVMVPIRTIDPIGAIGNYWAYKRQPTFEEVKILQSLADITAVAIENVNVYSELEKRVKDRTTQLEAAIEELKSFSYSVSHDLRAPLRSIMGYSKILEEDHSSKIDQEGIEIIKVIQESGGRMNKLIDDLLEFSKLGEKDLDIYDLDVNGIIREVVAELERTMKHNAIIILNLVESAYADRALLKQVWINLLSNAIKYSSKKENPVIEVGSYKTESEIIYYVKDNGAGFDMQYAEKLFGVFQRMHRSTEFEGTGIGLALIRRIVHKHNGRTWAEAKVNAGATFYFSLPLE